MPGPRRDHCVSDSVLHGTVLLRNFSVPQNQTRRMCVHRFSVIVSEIERSMVLNYVWISNEWFSDVTSSKHILIKSDEIIHSIC